MNSFKKVKLNQQQQEDLFNWILDHWIDPKFELYRLVWNLKNNSYRFYLDGKKRRYEREIIHPYIGNRVKLIPYYFNWNLSENEIETGPKTEKNQQYLRDYIKFNLSELYVDLGNLIY